MKEYKISGIPVEFPYKAYGPQLAYMSKVVATLEQSRLREVGHCNALLESPTGSGKSLALLCATLAWQKHFKANYNSKTIPSLTESVANTSSDIYAGGGGFIPGDVSTGFEVGGPNGCGSNDPKFNKGLRQAEIKPKMPRIFYSTRTHSQITQVVREFRKTKYRVPMAVLAARKFYCTNKQVIKKKNVDEDCKKLLREPEQPGCRHFKNVQKVKSHPSLQPGGCNDIHDIEDLVKLGHSVKGCSYFAARSMALEAEIVFCPYTYIMDPIIRRAMEVDIRGAIVILDEAHNIEDVARDAGSVDVEVKVLDDMRLELEHLCTFGAGDFYQPLLEMVQELLGWMNHQVNNLTKQEFEHYSSCWTGDRAIQELSAAGIPQDRFQLLLNCSQKAVAAASDEKTSHLSGPVASSLERLFSSLQFMLSNNARRALDYQVVVQRVAKRDEAMGLSGWVVTLSLWCLNPAVVFENVSAASRSIILTSGTLAPMESFASELGVTFDVRIAAPHVVDMDRQVWAAALSVGPKHVALNASYKNSGNFLFQDAVGAALVEIFKVTPDGVLVFLPSYKLLKKLSDRWRTTGQWALLAAQKKIFTEPQINGEKFEAVLHGYYDAVNGTVVDGKETSIRRSQKVHASVMKGSSFGGSTTGAAFLAVCRGKVSEGIDFSDKYARAVVVVGIPFPSVKDIQVSLKKQYNTAHKVSKNLLGGDQWYCQQAFRALNQAVGRCIRHRYDYGGILLLDERFKEKRNLEYMSKWLRKSIRQFDDFESSMEQLQEFFSKIKSIDLRASNDATELAYQKESTEVPSPGHTKQSKTTTPVPITPLKSETGMLRVSSNLEISKESSTFISSHTEAGTLSLSVPRFGLLPQFEEMGSTALTSCFVRGLPFQEEEFDNSRKDPGLDLMAESWGRGQSKGSLCPSSEEASVKDSADCLPPKDLIGEHEYPGLSIYSDGAVVNMDLRETSILDNEVTPADLEVQSESVTASKVENYFVNVEDCERSRVLGCYPTTELLSPEERKSHVSKPVASTLLQSTCGDGDKCHTGGHPSKNDERSETVHRQISCGRCGFQFGMLSSPEKIKITKSYLTALVDSNNDSVGDGLSSSSAVYLTGIGEVDSWSIGQSGSRGLGGEDRNSQKSRNGVWVEEDGCVFRPLMCPDCTNYYIGVHILAADNTNLTLIDKVAILAHSISFSVQENLVDGKTVEDLVEALPCEEVQNEPVVAKAKRAQPTPTGKGKLKLRRREG